MIHMPGSSFSGRRHHWTRRSRSPATAIARHCAFWEQGWPAIMITDTAFYRNAHYHAAYDTPDTLDYIGLHAWCTA
jgi:hypothetical protein